MFASIIGILNGFLGSLLIVWGWVWWIVLPLVTGLIFWEAWMHYIHFVYISSIRWILLEIKIPREILKTPKSMEQIFAAAHAPYSYGMRMFDLYWKGKVEDWYSFEIVSVGGEIHFYIRLYAALQKLIESAVFSQYPDAEIHEVPDYLESMPKTLPNDTLDIFGQEYILKKPNPLPIRTYPMFEEAVEERRVDPMAAVLEIMSRLKPEEQIWFQIVARPSKEEWREDGQKLIDEIMGRKKKTKPGFFSSFFGAFTLGLTPGEIFKSPFEHPSDEVKKEKDSNGEDAGFSLLYMTKGQRDLIEAIEMKTSKIAFETTLRVLYIDRKDSFSKENVSAILGAIRQFNTQNLNALKPDATKTTQVYKGVFKKRRELWRKQFVYRNYQKIALNRHKPILNIEELATLYHFPAGFAAPHVARIGSKQSAPPAGLPIMPTE